MALVAAVQGGPGQVGDAVLQGIEAVIQRQQRMPATRDAHRFLCFRQHCGRGSFGPIGASCTYARRFHFATVFGWMASRSASVFRRS